MQHLCRPLAAGVLVGAVLLAAGCSDPAPVGPPPPPTVAPAPSTAPSATPTVTPTAAPSATRTTAAAQPSAGTGGGVEPSRPVTTAPPKRLDESTSTAGARVSLVSVRATTIKATGPGDRSGPGVLVRLRLVSSTGRSLDTSFTQVSLTGAEGQAGTLVDGAPSKPVDASIKAGRSAEGTYAFLLDDAASSNVTVSVYVTAGQPVVTFRGRVS